METINSQHKEDRWLVFCFIFTTLSVLTMPLWLSLLFLAVIIFWVPTPYRLLFVSVLIIVSAFFNSGIDITGDLSTYSAVFSNLNKISYVEEFSSEPLLLFLYGICNQLGLDFKSTLFMQSLCMNIVLLYALCTYFGFNGLKFFPAIILYPQFIQQGLFLSRQSLSTLFFITLVAQSKLLTRHYFRNVFWAGLALLAHSSAVMNIGIFLLSYKVKRFVKWYFVLPVVIVAILFPFNDAFVTQHLVSLANITGGLDRKIGFYMNNMPDGEALSIMSLLMLPLHATFLVLSVVLIKSRKDKSDIDPFSIIFICLYCVVLFLREYSLLPTRLGMPIVAFSAFFFYNITTLYKQYLKNIHLMESLFFIFICLTFIRFLYTNDYGDYAITLFGKQSLISYPIDILFRR
ncbi:EpsG family protein [Cronobacter dublinensis]|uniref:Wzy n=2 Tax=Cronobacter dublinensis TaxID=413497 RepID=M9NGK0_9ENTR|nr:EpsG family protein [Cronobacter dublinensis]AFI81953.1 Wzy [Cronobacter dublinensis subsp. dublinensis LMG 23823]ALB67372.1 hypothetical protein AFK67_13140 [Cronobacter dublinensis subsp. dublinensis LMG 23823]MDI7270566.1 EpsG family protein [Cronobacter dublinensis]MDI7503133.1 EpsG family protein [Cronobacter dublinensis]